MEELGVWKNLYLVANSWKVTALKQGPLSEITVSGIPWVANSSLAAVITLFAVLHCEKFDFNPSGVVVNSVHPPYSNKSMLILSQWQLGKDDGIKGSLGSGSS